MLEVFDRATWPPFGYIMLDLHPASDDRMRVFADLLRKMGITKDYRTKEVDEDGSTRPVRNEQICNRSVLTKTDQLQTTLSSAESVFCLLQTLSLNTLRDVNTADAKQTNNRSADYLQRLQMICNTLKPKKRYNIGETLTAHLLFDT